MKTFKVFSLILSLLAVLSFSSCVERIDAGHEGIEVSLAGDNRGVSEENLVTGWVFYNPLSTRVFEYPTFVQTIDYPSFKINAKDGSEFIIDPTISLYIQTGKTPIVFNKYRKELSEVINGPLFNYVKDAFRIQINAFTTDEIVSNREQVEKAIEKVLSEKLESEGFALDQLTSGLAYPATIVNSVNAKNQAIQDAMAQENKVREAVAVARQGFVKDSIKAEGNKILSSSITQQLLDLKRIENWDGKYPTTYAGNSSGLLLNVK